MPRIYVRKHANFGRTPAEVMERAVQAVRGGMPVRQAAKEFGIPRGTLRCNLKKGEGERLEPNYKHSQVFSNEQEKMLAEYILNCAHMFHGLTVKKLRSLVYDLARANKLKYPNGWDKEKMAGRDWYYGFMQRNAQLSVRQPEATSLARATAFNRHTVSAYFDILEAAYNKHKVTGAQIFNLDETGVTTVHKVPKIVGPKGFKQVGQVTSGERGELVTMCCIVSATGQAVPPVFVFPRKNLKDALMNGAPEGSLGLVHSSGWMTADNFVLVIKHIARHVRPSPEHPIIVIMDNHESHIGYSALEEAKANNITIITLPPHTSNKTQPLDRTVFGPLKAAFNQEANSWMLRNPGKTISIYQLAELGGKAFTKAATPTNIVSGFKAAGAWPLDKDVFESWEFMPSQVTDRPAPQQTPSPTTSANAEQPSTSQPLNQAELSDQLISTDTQRLDHEERVQEAKKGGHPTGVLQASPSISSAAQAEQPPPSMQREAPTSSPCLSPSISMARPPESHFEVSPVDLCGYPRAGQRKQSNRGRKRGKTMNATSTPEMKRIREEAENKKMKKRSRTTLAKKLFADDDSDSDISLRDVFENESENESDSMCESNVLSLDVVQNVDIDDFVVVEFASKTKRCYYVGQVLKPRDEDDDVEIEFFRKKGSHFVKPPVRDVSSVHIDDIKAILAPPTLRGTTNRTRGELFFSVNFGDIDIR